MSEQKADLSGILDNTAPTNDSVHAYEQYGNEVLAAWEKLLSDMSNSIMAAHTSIKALMERVYDLEQCITFLLSKDPVLGPKIKESLKENMSAAVGPVEDSALKADKGDDGG